MEKKRMKRSELNEIYRKLDHKAREISKLLNCTFNYYNGHYHKNEAGNYQMDYFPIPVIEMKGVCDIEIDLNQVSITAKLTREQALSYDFEKVKSYNFEAYGVENYLDDFYTAGNTINAMIKKITKSNEESIFFSFYFPYETDPNGICEFVEFIHTNGFFY